MVTLPIHFSSSPVPAASSPGCRSGLPHRVDPRLRVVPLSPRGARERCLSRFRQTPQGFAETRWVLHRVTAVVHSSSALLHTATAAVHSLCTAPVDSRHSAGDGVDLGE